MKQKSINSFFAKPAGAAVVKPAAGSAPAPPPAAVARDFASEPSKSPKPKRSSESKKAIPKASEAEEESSPALQAPARKRLKRNAVIEDEADKQPAARAAAAAAGGDTAMAEALEDDVGTKPKRARSRSKSPAGSTKQQQQDQQQQQEPDDAGAAAAVAEAKSPATRAAAESAAAAVDSVAAKQKATGTIAAIFNPRPTTAAKVAAAASTAKKPARGGGRTKKDEAAAVEAAAAGEPGAAPAAAAAGEEGAGGTPKRRAASPRRKAAAAGGASPSKSGGNGAGGEDDVSTTSSASSGGDPIEDSEPEGDARPVDGPAKKGGKGKGGKKAGGGAKKGAAKKLVSQVEGVGSGALAAAAKLLESKIEHLITWKEGEPVPYLLLANTFEAISETTKRLEIVALLVASFRAILATTPGDLLPAVYLCVNRVAPAHSGLELGIGEATLIKALAEATGQKEASLKKAYEKEGDLGIVAVSARGTQKTMFAPKPLTVTGVLKTFKEIAQASGSKSQEHKKGMIIKLLAAAKGNEPGYIVRSLQAKLRIGLAEQSVLVALAQAVHAHREGLGDDEGALADKLERAAQAVKTAYSECPSYDMLVPALLAHGTDNLLEHCHFVPGVPIKPMLAKATNGVGEVLDKFSDQPFTVEYKYDGERAQIHVVDRKHVYIYSRNSENNTVKYPDIVARLPGQLQPHVTSLVIDSEVVAWDPQDKKILPFQVLSTRARKDVQVGDIKVPVAVFAFDCLYLNGVSLIHRPLTERREALYSALTEVEGQMAFATAKTSRDVEELETFLNEAVDAATEGLIVKTLGDTYEPSKRSSHWLKLKKDYLEGVGDTFDLVPLGAFYGRGKRAGVFGAYLLAVYDPDTEAFQTICKLGTGFSEEQLAQLAETMREAIIPQPKPYYRWGESLVPDVWFDAVAVWEVKAADLSISPVHQAAHGLVEPSKGISIRFPRLMRVRDDKSPEDATSAQQVVDMFQAQAVRKQTDKEGGKAVEADDDDA